MRYKLSNFKTIKGINDTYLLKYLSVIHFINYKHKL